MNRLSVRRVSLQVLWLGKGDAATVDLLDWEVDGVSLREKYDADTEMTILQDEEWIRPHRAEAIARLRGELTDPPTYVPEWSTTVRGRVASMEESAGSTRGPPATSVC